MIKGGGFFEYDIILVQSHAELSEILSVVKIGVRLPVFSTVRGKPV